LPNVGPYIYDVSISGFTRSSIYIYDISSLRVKIDVTGVGYECGRFIAANVKAQGGGRITLSCKERGEVDRTGTGSGALTVFGEKDVKRSNAVNKRLLELRSLQCTSG